MTATAHSSNNSPVLIMAGGTGGHVYPALAVADELRKRGVPVVWMGTHKGIEARLVPEAGIDVDWLSVSGLRGKGVFALLMAPLNLLSACIQSMRIILHRKPCAVLGMGGFVSGPGGLMARLLGRPLLIHEQNAIPGMTNRLLSLIATKVMSAFPDGFKRESLHVGNPVRSEIADIPEPGMRLKNRHGRLKLFVFGGSLGAARLNEVVPQALERLPIESRPEVRHQAGKNNIEQARSNYAGLNIDARVDAYIDDMAEAYAWADLVICRAGAMTIAELAAAGVASVLVPYPYAVDDHQTFNAKYLADAGAAMLVQQSELTVDVLEKIFLEMDHAKIFDMSIKARSLGMPESTVRVTDECLIAGGVTC
ncbi:MAG: undecaprenyldiphospho-muramoylpentapeptide beta-N-acetylglucosaminyltransferase [Gammaproteobacteria bacterium]|nr:undecaprenyldiphospho-muramoylpentapeptide beta-N-acetylglucosaminyltransferase [Gammaproteobacteria bacterium]